ncbi:MAG: hypothetical protein GF335_03335 [Candidatus Moranbacteria bacterium]|nr:hypothetical protein [Candidatus Moranbacteria bacterium]
MKLLKFPKSKETQKKVKNPGPALKKIIQKLKKIREKKLYGLTAVGEFLVDSITPENSIEEAEKSLDYKDRPGGSPANTAVNFFKLGISANLIAKIGYDFNGKFLLKNLKQQSFPSKGIVREYKKPTSRVLIATGTEGKFDLSKTHREADTNLRYKDVDQELVKKAFCLTSGIFATEYPTTRETILKIFKLAKKREQLILIDPDFNGFRRFRGFDHKETIISPFQYSLKIDQTPEYPEEILKKIDNFIKKYLRLADIVTPSRLDAKRYLGSQAVKNMSNEDIAKKYYEISDQALVVMTVGAEGSLIYDGKNFYNIPPYKAFKSLSTKGAGDAFKAGFLAGLERSRNISDIVYCAALGNIVGAYCTSQIGAWIQFPGLGKWFRLGRDLFNKVKIYKKS